VPPTFAYVMMFLVWLVFASGVWLAAGLMLLSQRARRAARPLGLAMAATFPAVILFQIAASPVVAAILLAMPGPSSAANRPALEAVSFTGVLFAFAIAAGMSLAGFFEGWRIGWRCGKGEQLRAVIEQGKYAKLLRSIWRRPRTYSPD
jgi:hypothetical protein